MDMNTNRYEKPVQTPSRGAVGASPDCVTIEQSMKMTAAEVCWNLADKAEPTRYQETALAAEGTGTDGTTNVRGRSIDCNKRRTTVRKLPTDCVEFTEPTSARVSPVVAETAHTDGTRVMQYQWDDQKSIKTKRTLKIQFVILVMMNFSLMRNGLFRSIWFNQGWLLIMLTGQLETGTITVDVGRGPEVKMTLPAMKIIIWSTDRSRN